MEILQTLARENISAFIVLSVSILCDIFTGVVKAVIDHDLKSSKFKEGLLKKTYDYILVIIGICLDWLLGTSYICKGCLYALVAMEFYSCIENLRNYIPVPETISKALDILCKKEEATK